MRITRNDLISNIMISDKLIVLIYKNDNTIQVAIDSELNNKEIEYMIDGLKEAIHNYIIEKEVNKWEGIKNPSLFFMFKYILLDLVISYIIAVCINKDNLLYTIRQITKNNKIKLYKKINYKNKILYYLKLPIDFDYKNLINVIDRLNFIYDAEFNYFLEKTYFVLEKKIKQLNNFYEFKCFDNLCLGYSENGPEYFEFDNKNNWAMLVTGMSGSGKSVFMKSLILQLYLLKKHLFLMDLKAGIEFDIFKDYIHVIDNLGDAINFIEELKLITYKRYEELKQNKQVDDLYIFIDEFTNLLQDKKTKNILEELFRVCRASKIHFVLGTQRPDFKNIPATVKANIPVTCAFKARDVRNSMLITGDERLKDIKDPGRFYLISDDKEILCQSMFVDEKIIKNYLKTIA